MKRKRAKLDLKDWQLDTKLTRAMLRCLKETNKTLSDSGKTFKAFVTAR